MLVNFNDILYPAKKNKYAVGLFNAVNLELARGIISAAEETGSPVIMGSAEVLLPYGPLEEISYFLIPMAKKANVPVVIHFDHGLKKKPVLRLWRLGLLRLCMTAQPTRMKKMLKKSRKWHILPTPTAQQSKASSDM